MRGEEDLKSEQRRPKRQRRRMSEDEYINFDASASRYECPGWTRGNRDRILNVKYKRYDTISLLDLDEKNFDSVKTPMWPW